MISVITPVYNGERFIESCIKVVIDQNCPESEHIIVDGNSKDRTVDIIKQYAQKYPHIRWISEKDKGQSDAMNKGIAMAKGEILAILNVDDYYEQNVLNRVLEIFKTLPEPSFVAGNCNIWVDEGELLTVNRPKKLKLTDLLLGPRVNPFPMNPSAYFYHTLLHEKIGPYQVEEHYTMDLDFILRTVQVANLKYVDEIWGNYRKFEGTKTVNDINNGQNMVRVQSLLNKYQKNLPFLQRWHIPIRAKIYEELLEIKFKVEYFWKNPQEFIPSLKTKVLEIFGAVS